MNGLGELNSQPCDYPVTVFTHAGFYSHQEDFVHWAVSKYRELIKEGLSTRGGKMQTHRDGRKEEREQS